MLAGARPVRRGPIGSAGFSNDQKERIAIAQFDRCAGPDGVGDLPVFQTHHTLRLPTLLPTFSVPARPFKSQRVTEALNSFAFWPSMSRHVSWSADCSSAGLRC